MFKWNPDIKISDVLTSASILISACGLMYTLFKDRQLRKREYADKIRRSAAETVVSLERWKELALRFYSAIQPLITDADVMLTREGDVIAVRDFFWHKLVLARAESTQRIVTEKLESSYIGLYGYNPTIQLLYESTILLIKKMDEEAYSQLLMATQQNILELENVEKPYYSAQLGNKLRSTCSELSNLLEIRINNVLNKFRTELMKIITASDIDIVKKSTTIAKLSGTISGDVEGRIRRSGEKNR